ncbi:MAG TPA: DUF222 domain-containing protein [Friedmanniella sp.]
MEIEGEEAVEADCALEALEALDDFEAALGRLIDAVEAGGLDGSDGLRLVGFLQRFERARNQMALVDHRAIGVAEAMGVPETWTQPSMIGVLATTLRISRGEAGRRVRAAEQVGNRVTMTGDVLEPLRPALAAAQRAGEASPEQVDVCLRAIGGVDHRGFDPADLDAADALLAGFVTTFGPKELNDLAARVVERIDPDGTAPQEQVNADRRHLALRRTRDGMYAVEGRLTGAVGAKLTAVLSPLAAPRVETVTLEDGREVNSVDPRHHGQRNHDALEEVCDRLLRSGTLPDSGGTPATVIVTITEDQLRGRRGTGTTSDGSRLSADTVVGVADEADVYVARLSPLGVVLDLGRTRRCASPGQTAALITRDAGCSFPGCSRPPEWCERHHIVAWVDGGPTDLANLTLLCAYHHHHFASRGWTCVMIDDLPAWIPPRWVDPGRRPLRNARIVARQLGLGLTQ